MAELKAMAGIGLCLVLLVGLIYGLLVSAEKPKHISE